MEVNLPVWKYYDSGFVDPLYVPYQRKPVKSYEPVSGEPQICPTNTWVNQGYADGLVHPELVREGWGLDFQLMHPDKDPCPHGWIKGQNGMCHAEEPEFQGTLYTDRAHVPKYQYWGGYAPKNDNTRMREISQFDRKSIHPETGHYLVSHRPHHASQRGKYGRLPSKDSFLA